MLDELKKQDDALYNAMMREYQRQQDHIELIASENFVSKAVLEAAGSVLTNKYAEGYSGARYYGGCAFVDEVEDLAISRVKKLFGSNFANVQPHSGAQANFAVFFALLSPGDTFLGMDLAAGGHLTHGSPVTVSGKWFKPVGYHVDPKTYLIDYDQVRKLALENRPKLIIAGGSAYPREIDFALFRKIADEVGAYLMVDMAHFAGLVAAGVYPNPVPHAHVITSTTHKTLRGPRGGIILSQDEVISKKINSAVFPGSQGGPLMHIIAAKAAAFEEALRPEFKQYAQMVVRNARSLSQTLHDRGFSIITGGTDSHLILVDVTPKNTTGKEATQYLESLNITCNKNSIPFDTLGPKISSGIRLGTPACTTRGFKEFEFEKVGHLIADSLEFKDDPKAMEQIKERVAELLSKFPLPY
jgi:glycine hydroxymethyltransferase